MDGSSSFVSINSMYEMKYKQRQITPGDDKRDEFMFHQYSHL